MRTKGRSRLSRALPLSYVAACSMLAETAISETSAQFSRGTLQVAGQTESFLQHMRLGVSAAAKDPAALLMFSGAQPNLSCQPCHA